jgi:outer membrane protein assembly factor BamB
MSTSLRALVLIALTSSTIVAAQDWNQWRGPARTGRAAAFKAPADWPERPKQAWKIPAGEGHASPVVQGARVYLFSRAGEQEALTAYNLADGRQLWRQAYDAPYRVNPAATSHGKGVKSTPLVHRGRIYTLGIGGILSAFDEAGKLAWRKDFKGEFPSGSPAFGASMSPVGDGDLVIAHVGGEGGGALTAFEAATGTVRWAWKGDGPGYASPIVADFGGVRQVITQSQSHVVAVSVADGRLLWQIPFTTDYEQNIVTPVAAAGLLVYSGLSKPTTAVRVELAGGKWSTTEVWKNADVPMYMSSPVEAGGILFGLTHRNRGQYFAVDMKTGRTLWTSQGRQGENAALVVAGTLLLAANTEGELVIVRQDPKAYGEVRRYTVAESPVWAHPVPTADGGVLIKDAGTLSYWRF